MSTIIMFRKIYFIINRRRITIRKKIDNVVYLITSIIFESKIVYCRKCKIAFFSRNKLHKHFRVNCFKFDLQKTFSIIEFYMTLLVEINLQKTFNIIMIIRVFNKKFLTKIFVFQNDLKKFFANAFNNSKKFFANVFVDLVENVCIIVFNVNFNKNVEIDQKFRDWDYIRINVVLFFIDEFKSICLNIEVDIILSNKIFFKNHVSNIFIRKIIFSISIRDVKTKKYQFDEYVIVFIYIFDHDKDENVVKIMIIKKIHLIDNLKINMLFEIDLIESKKIDINILNKTIYIDNCDVIASLKIKTSRIVVRISIHARKIIVVSSYFEITLSIHYITISIEKNYFFESNEFIFFCMFI